MISQYRAESTDHCTAGSGITTKIPPLSNGSMSWLKYEELIDDWLDLTVLEAEKNEALKNRLVGDAEMHNKLLDRELLKAAEGVKYFRDTMRPHFINRAQSVFIWRFFQFTRAKRGNIEMVKRVGHFTLLLKRLKDSRMDMQPMSTLSEEQKQNQYPADVGQENADRQTRSVELLEPNAQATRDRWNATHVSNHERLFPFSDNLTTLMFIVASDVRERFTSSFSLRGMNCLWNCSVRRKARWKITHSA